MNLGTLLFGAFGNHRILLVEPLADRRRRLLVGLLQGLLRSITPALQVFAGGPNRQANAETGLDQLADRLARPKCIAHLQLVRSAILNEPLNFSFLVRSQQTPRAFGAVTVFDLDRRPAATAIGMMRPQDRVG